MLAAACMVAAGAALVTCIYAFTLTAKNATERDYIEYWASEQQLAHGANPYDVAAVLRLEQQTGMEGDTPKLSFSPPVALIVTLPLGYMSAKTGLILWLLFLLGCTGASAWVLWFLHHRPQSRYHLLVFAFPPTLGCLMAGQLGVLLLLDIVLFFWLHEKRPWLAGAALVFCALKPHLFLLCLVVLLLWSLRRRDFRVLGGFMAVLALSSALTLCIDVHVWSQYSQMMRSTRVMDVFIPTLGVVLRDLVNPHARWIEFLPEMAGCLWAAWYYWSRRDRWSWTEHGLLLLLVSAVCTSYAWFTDEAMLFPAILAAMYRSEQSTRAWILLGLVTAGCLVSVFWEIPLPSPFYLWTAPAWLLWYLYAMHGKETNPVPSGARSSASN
jgi:hypothetical protein